MAGQLPEQYMDQLESWIGTGPKIFTLLYKITKDGCDAKTFHQKCDNKGPTVTVLYNQQGSVYGGYASMNWHSTEAYIYDGQAFLFQLKFSGSDKYAKFPVLNATYGLYGKSNYGPTFGGQHDLRTFYDTITSSGGSFPLNGYMKMTNQFYNNMGLTSDQINNGTMAVVEMEIYNVTDGERENVPWRKTPEWNEKFLETLMEDIVAFKPTIEMGLTEVRVLMVGPVGSGKSSFYNTVNSVFKGRISHRATTGKSSHSITSAYTPHVTKSRSGSELNFRLCDTRGLEVTKGLNGLLCIESNYLLDGHVPDYYEFNPAVPISPETHGFVAQPAFADKIHCVAFVLDASSIKDMPPKLVKKMINTQKVMNHKGIPQVVLLSKVDLECKGVASNVFKSASIKDAVEKVSTMFGVQLNKIFPVKNYVSEMELDVDTSILALLALRQILYLTEDYMEGLHEKMKRLKVSAVNCEQPSEKANDKE